MVFKYSSFQFYLRFNLLFILDMLSYDVINFMTSSFLWSAVQFALSSTTDESLNSFSRDVFDYYCVT